jgi:hypothetical protein
MPRGQYLAEAVKDVIWVLRAEGVSEAEIAGRLVMPKRTVSKYLQRMGGIRPRPCRRSERCLSLPEREEISRGSLEVNRPARSVVPSAGPTPPSPARSTVAVAVGAIARTRPSGLPGVGPSARERRSSRCVASCVSS